MIHGERFHQQAIAATFIRKYFMGIIWPHVFIHFSHRGEHKVKNLGQTMGFVLGNPKSWLIFTAKRFVCKKLGYSAAVSWEECCYRQRPIILCALS